MTRHRADIDGLRCVAILPVIFFHYGIPGFAGGFVGVDIFFVISGYLIAGIIFSDIRSGQFSLSRFYVRRARRIFPALFTMMAATALAAIVILFPSDLEIFARSLIWTVFFVSNVGFWKEIGYFDALNTTMPLLHTWSLAVEEQFYLIFPLLLFFLRRTSRRTIVTAMVLLSLISFGILIWFAPYHPNAAFYLGPPRAWELGLGAILGIGNFPPLRHGNAFAALGLGLVAAAVAGFGNINNTGIALMAMACCGTAILIQAGAGQQTVIGRGLSLSPIVFVGAISYSLYLWHWPLFVLFRYVTIGEPAWPAQTALLLVTFALAITSWRFVETPFRRGAVSARVTLRLALAGSAALLAGAALILIMTGLPGRFPGAVVQLAEQAHAGNPRQKECFDRPLSSIEIGSFCVFGDGKTAPDFLLWGDSHADALLPGITDAARHQGRNGEIAAHSRCAPLLGANFLDAPECRDFNDAVMSNIRRRHVRAVILTAWWGIASVGVSDESGLRGTSALSADLERTVAALTREHATVVIMASTPELGWNAPRTLAENVAYGRHLDIRMPTATFEARERFDFALFERLHRRYGAQIVYPHRILCQTALCAVSDKDRLFYIDEHHLSAFGARYIVQRLPLWNHLPAPS